MSRVKAALVALVLAAGLLAAASPRPAEALPVGAGYWASMLTYTPGFALVFVYPSKVGGYQLQLQRGSCYVIQKIPLLNFTSSAKLKQASVTAETPCGWVSIFWEATGNIKPYAGVLAAGVQRVARAAGWIGNQYFTAHGGGLSGGAYIGFGK